MKNLKTIFGMAAFAIMAVACSNDDDVLNSQQPEQHAKEQGIPFIATISASQADDQTRAVGESGNTFTSNYVKDEQVYLLYQIGNSKYEATATVTEVDGSGNATIEATLESGIANNTEVTLIYPASAAATNKSGNIKDGILSEQVGTLSAVPDIRKGTSTFVVDGGTATLADGTTLAFDGGGNTTAPAYYTTGTALRMYPKNSMAINAGSKKIVAIEIVCDEYQGTLYNASGDITANDTKMTIDGTSLKYTGPNASTATIANTSSTTGAASQLRMKTLKITYAE